MFEFHNNLHENKVANPYLQVIDNYSQNELPERYGKYLRIHGDNIVECERTLQILKKAYKGTLTLLKSPLYKPKYSLHFSDKVYIVELFSGHKRWGVNVLKIVQDQGGILNEGADSYVTELKDGNETIIFALEYCSALPAGNNAWQRNGRALACVLAGIPYLYYAEIGGVELDGKRKVKAPRFPNPVVPFSYISTSKSYNCCCIPVYKTHPTITEELYHDFENILGEEDGAGIIRALIEKEDKSEPFSNLVDKDISLVKHLSSARRCVDTLRGPQWDVLLNSDNRDEWLENKTTTLTWLKKSSEKVLVSDTFKDLLETVINFGCRTIGGKDVPVCVVPKTKIKQLENKLKSLYPDTNISLDQDKPLAIVWINGFKPRGDDSRPDRGLAPLARMVLGDRAKIMSIVFGPAKTKTWKKLKKSVEELYNENGLWLTAFKLCNYTLIDCATIDKPRFYTNNISLNQNHYPVTFKMAGDPISFTEDDTDCAIHQIFAHKSDIGILEGMCNPPGGDWSGISYFDKETEYRWTSLPRVSKIGGKRPDHVIQVNTAQGNVCFSIESKGKGCDLETNVGKRLADYLRDLFSGPPTAHRKAGGEWRRMNNAAQVIKDCSFISIGAFMYNNDRELETHIIRGNLDAILAFQLGKTSVVHVMDKTPDKILERTLKQAEQIMTGFIIQVH